MSPNPSILRYPGGKTRLSPTLQRMLEGEPQLRHIVEPFCGGASISIQLIESGALETAALNDIDLRVSSLWQVVFGKTEQLQEDFEWLLTQVREHPVDLPTWHAIKRGQPKTTRERAWACLFLNRTSFNGIMTRKAGPIGGKTQQKNQVGVRFHRLNLEARLRQLHALAPKISEVSCEPWDRFAARHRRRDTLLYLDPPYYHRGRELYSHAFTHAEHVELADWVKTVDTPWLLSYDDAPEVRALYPTSSGLNIQVLHQNYSNTKTGGISHAGQELMISNIWALRTGDENTHIRFVGNAGAVDGPGEGTLKLPIGAVSKRK